MTRLLKKKRKTIDIDKEINGKAVAPVGKKEKKLDLTEEIKAFIDDDINLEKIKRIILRLEGPITSNEIEKCKIKALKVSKHGYFITINQKGIDRDIYMNSIRFIHLTFFGEKDLASSKLKSDLQHKIYDWLRENIHEN
jgi:hypothetical protein